MTSGEFRQDANKVNELRTVLANPILQEALLVIHDSKSIVDEGGEQLASVRKLSNLAGRAEVVRELYEMATPLPESKPAAQPTFGVTESPPENWTPDML